MDKKVVVKTFRIQNLADNLQVFCDKYKQRNEKIADLVLQGRIDDAQALSEKTPNFETLKALESNIASIFEDCDFAT